MGLADRVPPQSWPGYALMGALYSAPVILVVWLVMLWPLYVRVPAGSILWHPSLCIGGGCVAGVALYYLLVRFIFRFPAYAAGSLAHLSVGAAVGAVTCATGYILNSLLKNSKTRNPIHSAIGATCL